MKKQNGITLIALVITIIVLLILAGVSIAMLTGQNGILNQATSAKDASAKAEVVERINMELSAAYGQVLAGKTSFEDADITAINKNLTANSAAKATASKDSTGKILTITGTGDYTAVTGNVNITTKTLTEAK